MGTINYSAALADATRQMLDKLELKYDFDEDRGVFRLTIKLGADQKLQHVKMFICIGENAVTSFVTVDMKADTASLGAVAEYITRANYGLRLGNFEMDYRDGEVRYRCHNFFGDWIPSGEELETIAVGCPVQMWRRYGNGFLKVLFGGMSAKDAIEETERG